MDDLCPEWAEAGECTQNPTYMVGTRARPGKCLKSCRRCELVLDSGAEDQQQQQRVTATATHWQYVGADPGDPSSRQRFRN